MRSLPTVAALVALAACEPTSSRSAGWLPPTNPPPAPVSPSPPDPAPTDAEPSPDTAPDDEPRTEADQVFLDAYGGLLDGDDGPEAEARDTGMEQEAPPARPVEPRGRPDAGAWAPAAFGPRLLSVLPGTQPPRAVLSLADGREVVVRPGSMLPEDGLVVLAVGTEAIEIAEITPEGDRATVQTRSLQPLYDRAPSAPSGSRANDPIE